MSMTQEPTKALELFYSYAHTDERWRKRLEIHLSNLKRQGFIVAWHDQNISAGTTWASEINVHLNTAHIILLLISPDFIASDYCYSIEMTRAMERHQAGEARVIPVILRPTDWEGTPFKQLQALPTNARAVTRWQNRDDALLDVVNGIREAVKELLASTSAPSALASSTTGEKQLDITAIRLKPEPIWKVPTTFTPLVGRDQDVNAVCALLSRPEMRLLTLLGAGGIGKTRLAIQIATEVRDAFPDGVCFVPLEAITDPSLLAPTIAHELGIHELGTQSLIEQVKLFLREKHFLLLLDNFEQITEASPQVEELLIACPSLKIVVTSRAVLHVQGEQEFPVPPLALPNLKQLPESKTLSQYASVALFVQRACTVVPAFQLTQANARSISEICVRLDGLPLAIELAAARIKLLPPHALLSRLSQRLQVLTSGARTLPARQQTLRSTIKWSYDLLETKEQQLFRLFSVFVGGCTLEAVEVVSTGLSDGDGDGAGLILELVTSLIDKSLLHQTEQAAEEPRLVMLETIREYGMECLALSGEEEVTRHAHASYYLELAEEAEPKLSGLQQILWLEYLEREHDNLRAAMQWSLKQGKASQSLEQALRLSKALQKFWKTHGHYSEGRSFLQQVLAGSEGIVSSLRVDTLGAAGELAYAQGDYEQAEGLAGESLALSRELGDTRGIAASLALSANVAWAGGNRVVAGPLTEKALALSREIGDKEGIVGLLFELGWRASTQGEYARARALFEECLAMYRELGDIGGIASTLFQLADVLFHTQGDSTRVRSLLEESSILFREMRNKEGIAYTLGLSAELALSQGDAIAARSLMEKSLALYREIGDQSAMAFSLSLLAKVIQDQDDYAIAQALYEESLMIFIKWDARGGGAKREIASCLEGLASVAAVQGEPEWAAQLWGTAEALREDTTSVERVPYEYEQMVAAARIQLGEKDFASAWAEGRAMTPEQALAAKKYTAGS